jgi:hypothetical protein
LKVVVAFVGFLLACLVVRRPWVYGIFECLPELIALLDGVVALQMPQTLLSKPVFEAAGGLFRVVFRRALNSRDCVV